MLKKSKRLNLRTQHRFQQSITAPFFTLKSKKNETGENKFAVVVGKRVDKRATVRNKIKRSLYLNIQNVQESIRPGYDLLVIAKGAILKAPKEEISKSFFASLKNNNLLP